MVWYGMVWYGMVWYRMVWYVCMYTYMYALDEALFNLHQTSFSCHFDHFRPGDSHTQNGGLEQLFESDLS